MTNASESNIMTVSELIDSAFGEPHVNIVNHKHIQTVLHLLARQLRVLERRILVQISSEALGASESTLSVTELKLQATTNKKKKSARQKSDTKILHDIKEMGSKTSTDKTSTDKTSTDKTSTDKSSTDKTSTDKTSTDKTSTDKSSTDKTSTDKTSTDKTSTDKTSTDKTSTDKTSTDKTSTDKTSSNKTSSNKSSSDKTSTDKTSTDKTSTDKTSSNKTSSNKSSSDKTSTDVKSTSKTEPSSSSPDEKSRSLQDYQKLLETVEETREREVREIRQRVNSREERDKTPTPMASMDSVEATIEKLLVVERVSIEEANARARGKLSGSTESAARLSIVTKDQFEELVGTVKQLQAKFAPIPLPELPENAQLMQDLRKGASLTNAMAALQLSARLEATEKALEKILSLVTDLAIEIGVELKESTSNVPDTDNIKVIFGGDKDKKSQTNAVTSKSPNKLKIESINMSEVQPPKPVPNEEIKEPTKDKVTHEELDTALQEVSEKILKTVNDSVSRSNTNAANAMKLANQLDIKIKRSLEMGTKMEDLENLVANYTDQVNQLDTGLSSQMTNYQEELSQMQHSLEVGLENMAEMMANTGGDAMAVAELNAHFNDLQTDIDATAIRQKDLQDIQNTLSEDLESLRKQLEMLRETKSDRDEVADALQDKAGLGDLNGLVANEQFLAVLVDFEKRIEMAYDKFNHQEVTWQKAIDDIVRCLNEKADQIQVDNLRASVERYLEDIKGKVKFISDIVGEPSAAAVARVITRDQACLSCSSPAHIKLQQKIMPVLPAFRTPAVGTEAPRPREDGDHGLCYPGYPIPHPIDPRAHTCNRWCGGSHTMMSHTSRVPPGVTITNLDRPTTMERGTDGKMYAVDAQLQVREPCSQCLTQSIGPRPSETDSRKPESLADETSYNIMCDECLIGSMTPPLL